MSKIEAASFPVNVKQGRFPGKGTEGDYHNLRKTMHRKIVPLKESVSGI